MCPKPPASFFGVSVPGAGPATAIPATSHPANPSPVPATGVITGHDITGLAAGLGLTGPNSASVASQPGSNTGMHNDNLDICGVSIPRFAQNKSQHVGSNCTKKLTSGMFCTGKKEVKQKIVWPHHCVNSIIKPNGVEYDCINWQEMTNGFTGLILSKVNSLMY